MIEGSIDISFLFERSAIHSKRAICTSGEKHTLVYLIKKEETKIINPLLLSSINQTKQKTK